MRTSRLEAFSDGVFAIAATLLILDVRVSTSHPLGDELTTNWPHYAAYAISFITIGIMWVNHHAVIDQIERTDRTFLFINLFFLGLVAFVPFPSSLIAEHLRVDNADAQAAALAYGITLTVTAVFFNLLWWYASAHNRLLRADADPVVVRGITRSYLPGPWIYLAATLVALLNPVVSVVLYGAIAVFYMVESSVFGGRGDERPEREGNRAAES